MALLRLFDPTTQFQTKSGALNVAGKLRVYVENTDDLANIYGDDGSRLPQPLILDSNGRARGLFVNSGRSYRLEAYDRNDSLLFTIRRLEPNASGTVILEEGKVSVEEGKPAGYLKDILVSESDMVSLVPSGNQLAVNFDLILPSDVVRDSAYTHIDAATANPLMDGTAAVGVSVKYAREDHVHPSDTSREDKANKTTVVLGSSNSKYPTDKAVAEFVNSSIATNTANYISNNGEPFTSVEQLEAYSGTVTNNDYAFVTGIDSEGNTYYDRYKATVSGSTVTWALEYRLNNSSFTAAQWSAINSGITSVLVAKIHDHSNKDVLDGITPDKVNSWDGKEDAFDILPTTKGGTGTNAASKSALTSSLINSLSTELSKPVDADYYVSQYQNGGTSNTSFVRRPVSALWEYIKDKISSVLGLTASAYSGKAATAGTADKAVADKSGNDIETTYATKSETEEAISNSVDQTYSSTSTKAQSGVAVNEAFKTRETSGIDDSYTYLGMSRLGVTGPSAKKLYWKLVSFKPIDEYWTLQFEIDVCNGSKSNRSYDTEIYETKRLTIYGVNKDSVRNATELRYIPQTSNESRGYGNNIYYEMDSSKIVTVYIYAKKTYKETQICRLTSVRNLNGIDNITWHEAASYAGTQPTNPIKFKEDFPAIASKTSDIGSDSVPVYVSKGKPVSCNSSNLKAGKDDDGNVIKNTYQKKLTFDTTPTAGSSNPVTSDGIKTALNNYVGIYKGDSSNFHVKNNEYYSFICRTNISNWEKIQADFFCANSDSSTVGKFNIFATLSTTDTSLHTPERVAEFGGIVWDYNYKGYNTIKYRIYVAKSGDNFYFYAKRNSSNDKSITAFRSCLLYTTNPGLTDNVSADLDDATWQTLSLVEMKNVYSSTTQERLDSHTNDTTVHITDSERTAWNAKASTSVATTSANGLMSKTDKSKLDGISIEANKADVSYANSKLTKTINGTSSDVFAASEIITDTNTFGNFAAVTDVNVDGTIYHTYWKIAPTSSNNVYGFAAHPTIGVLFRIQNNKGRYYASRYDINTTYIFDGTYDSSTNKAATVSSITSRIATAKTELTAAIDSEASARESADTTLQSNIDDVDAKGIVINEINGENVICFE